VRFATGLGLLPVSTVMHVDKRTELTTATTRAGVRFTAYEIHVGSTDVHPELEPFARLDEGRGEGARAPGVIGTYLHGALEDPRVCAELFGVPAPAFAPKREQYERLADWFERHGRDLGRLGLE
jgi:adenosylcobyric acid synthase